MKKLFSLFVAALFCASMWATDTYTVAGAKAILGSDWSVTDTNNDMELVDGVYTLVKSDVSLGVGTYKYKVAKNHEWGTAGTDNWPADKDAELVIAEDGKYDVTFTFNESTKAVNAVAEKKGSVVIEKHPLLVGDSIIANGMKWNTSAAVNLMETEDDGATYTLTITNVRLDAKTNYYFKIVEKDSWDSYYDDGGENASFQVNQSAIYTITYTLTMEPRSCNVGTTMTHAFAEGYYIVGTFNSWIISDSYLMTANAQKDGEYLLENVTLTVGDEFKAVKLTTGSANTWYGAGGGNNYVVTSGYADTSKTIYFNVTAQSGWSNGHLYVEPNKPTAVDNTEVSKKAVKRIVDGQLVIERDGKFYNALGAEMK